MIKDVNQFLIAAFLLSFLQYKGRFCRITGPPPLIDMKLFISSLLIICVSFLNREKEKLTATSPLADYSSLWNDPKYLKCNTAAKASYMSANERGLIYILNLARMNPSLFANTVIKKYPEKSGKGYLVNTDYYKSLLDTMRKMKPVNLLQPDSLCYTSAFCHAVSSGNAAYTGHNRQSDECREKWYFNGECCDYGNEQPLDIVLSLLIDNGVPSLGHRWICLNSYKRIGVSIQPHKGYRYNAVLDFHY